MKPESCGNGNFLINSLVLYTCCHVLIVSNGCPNRIPQAPKPSSFSFGHEAEQKSVQQNKKKRKVPRLLIYLMYVL